MGEAVRQRKIILDMLEIPNFLIQQIEGGEGGQGGIAENEEVEEEGRMEITGVEEVPQETAKLLVGGHQEEVARRGREGLPAWKAWCLGALSALLVTTAAATSAAYFLPLADSRVAIPLAVVFLLFWIVMGCLAWWFYSDSPADQDPGAEGLA